MSPRCCSEPVGKGCKATFEHRAQSSLPAVPGDGRERHRKELPRSSAWHTRPVSTRASWRAPS